MSEFEAWITFGRLGIDYICVDEAHYYKEAHYDKVAHPAVEAGAPEQTYRLEIRCDFRGTEEAARAEAQRIASEANGEVTAIFDEGFNEI